MQILDKYGYLESALDYIERNIVSGKGLHKIANKTRINEDLLLNLSLALKSFSEKQLFTMMAEKLEDRHSSLSGAEAELTAADISIEKDGKGVFILLTAVFEIVLDGEVEDKTELAIKIYSSKNMRI